MGDEEKTNKAEHINIKLLGQDNLVVQFKVKMHTPLKKVMTAYCNHLGISIQEVRFRFDGYPVTEEDTANTLDMEEGDTIEVYQEQIGGFC